MQHVYKRPGLLSTNSWKKCNLSATLANRCSCCLLYLGAMTENELKTVRFQAVKLNEQKVRNNPVYGTTEFTYNYPNQCDMHHTLPFYSLLMCTSKFVFLFQFQFYHLHGEMISYTVGLYRHTLRSQKLICLLCIQKQCVPGSSILMSSLYVVDSYNKEKNIHVKIWLRYVNSMLTSLSLLFVVE